MVLTASSLKSQVFWALPCVAGWTVSEVSRDCGAFIVRVKHFRNARDFMLSLRCELDMRPFGSGNKLPICSE